MLTTITTLHSTEFHYGVFKKFAYLIFAVRSASSLPNFLDLNRCPRQVARVSITTADILHLGVPLLVVALLDSWVQGVKCLLDMMIKELRQKTGWIRRETIRTMELTFWSLLGILLWCFVGITAIWTRNSSVSGRWSSEGTKECHLATGSH